MTGTTSYLVIKRFYCLKIDRWEVLFVNVPINLANWSVHQNTILGILVYRYVSFSPTELEIYTPIPAIV